MNDIITDFIGKQIAKRLEQNRPIVEQQKKIFTDKDIDHFHKCLLLTVDCKRCTEINNKLVREDQ